MIDKIYIGKIGLGMAAVFGIGMVVASGVDAGKHQVHEIVRTNATLSVPLLGLPFRTAKGELGTMQKLRIVRSAPDMIESFDLTVRLNDGVSADQFNNCEVTVVDPENLNQDTKFTCITAADSGFEDLVQFGYVHFEPSNARHRLMIPKSVRDEIRSHGDTNVVVSGDSGAQTNAGEGSLNIKVNGKSVVEIHGDSAGGAVMIRNPETGEPIVDIDGGKVKVDNE
ncbi:MAG: hypothetical protein ABI542_09280 [Gemmatimonadota bacterium]